jgi:hypothetical protein
MHTLLYLKDNKKIVYNYSDDYIQTFFVGLLDGDGSITVDQPQK